MMAMLRSVLPLFLIVAAAALPADDAFAKAKSRKATPQVNKYAGLVVDAETGATLFARYAEETRHPASLTKMMTLYLLFEEIEAGRLTLGSDLKVSEAAENQPPSKLGLAAGTTIPAETAIKALVVKSANDAAVVVAEAVAGSEWRFAQKMTEKARALGMARTTFRNASGLPDVKQVTTALDLSILARRLAKDFPQHYHYFATSSFDWNGRNYRTHNGVTENYPGADGLKTGYTRMSGFNLVTSAKRDGIRLVGVVLGGRSVLSRDSHMTELLDAAFAKVKAEPNLVAAVGARNGAPRLKPTLVAELEAKRTAPTIGESAALQAEIFAASSAFSEASNNAETSVDDFIGALIASADSGDLNSIERLRLAASSQPQQEWGEGDVDGPPGAWSAQIGAFVAKDVAQRELEDAASVGGLMDRPRSIKPVSEGGKTLYRARFTSMSASESRTTCELLKARGRACFVVQDSPAAP